MTNKLNKEERKIMANIQYGIPPISGFNFIFYCEVDEERTYRLRDLFWIIPLCAIALAVGAFIGMFYALYPIQLLWIAPYLIILPLIVAI